MKAPVTVIIFNRPDHAIKLRECLRGEETRELFVVSDGPRINKSGELEQVEECRKIFSDWQGVVHFNFAETNMGCRARISSGLNWVFEHTDRTIILEDDLQPHPRFFTYCDEMLDKYSCCDEMMSVCGSKTFQVECQPEDVVFSKYANCWGWATWKRAWKEYDDTFDTHTFLSLISKLTKRLGSLKAAIYWYVRMQQVLRGSISSWFYCWMISSFLKNGLHVYPASNLIVNHGYGEQSTHTSKREPYMPVEYGPDLPINLKAPGIIKSNPKVDSWIDNNIYSKSLSVRLKWLLRKLSFS